MAESLRLARAAAEKAKAAREAPKSIAKLAIAVPADAKDVKVSKSAIEFKLGGGRAKAVVEGLRQQLTKDGWKEEAATLQDMAGMVSLKNGDQNVTVIYNDTRFMPAEVTIQAIGVELERAGEKK